MTTGTIDLDNATMQGLVAGFDPERMRRSRLQRLFASMAVHDLDAIIGFEYASSRYIADLRPLWAPNFLVRQAAVIARGEERVICFVHQDDTPNRRANMTWLLPDDIREFPTGIANFGAPAEALRPLVRALDELGVGPQARVGIDIGTVSSIDNLRAALAPRVIVDLAACMRDARMVKNEDELRWMRFASAVSDLAIEAAVDAIKPGVRECEVLAEAMNVFYRFGAEVPQCNLIVCSGPNTMPMQRYASDRRIEAGDLVMLDLGACYGGLFSELARTTVCGDPNPTQRAIFRTAMQIHEATIAAMTPGTHPADVQAAAGRHYLGSQFDGLMQRMIIAHGIGVGYAEAPFIPPPGSQAAVGPLLEPGVTLAVVPTLLVPNVAGGGGVRIEDVVVVTPDGPEVLARYPYESRLLD